MMIKPGEEIIAGNNQRFRVVDVVPFEEEDDRRSSDCYGSWPHRAVGSLGPVRASPERFLVVSGGTTSGPKDAENRFARRIRLTDKRGAYRSRTGVLGFADSPLR